MSEELENEAGKVAASVEAGVSDGGQMPAADAAADAKPAPKRTRRKKTQDAAADGSTQDAEAVSAKAVDLTGDASKALSSSAKTLNEADAKSADRPADKPSEKSTEKKPSRRRAATKKARAKTEAAASSDAASVTDEAASAADAANGFAASAGTENATDGGAPAAVASASTDVAPVAKKSTRRKKTAKEDSTEPPAQVALLDAMQTSGSATENAAGSESEKPASAANVASEAHGEDTSKPAKRRPGRPRRKPVDDIIAQSVSVSDAAQAASAQQTSAMQASSPQSGIPALSAQTPVAISERASKRTSVAADTPAAGEEPTVSAREDVAAALVFSPSGEKASSAAAAAQAVASATDAAAQAASATVDNAAAQAAPVASIASDDGAADASASEDSHAIELAVSPADAAPSALNRTKRDRGNSDRNGERASERNSNDRGNSDRNGERASERNSNDRNNKKRGKQNQSSNDKNAGQGQQQNQNQSQGQNQGQKQNQNQQNQGKNNKNAFDRDHRRQRRQHGNREVLPSISRDEFAEMKVGDLREKAAEYGIDASGYRKAELIDVVFEALCKAEGIIEVTGILDIMNDGYGFLRTKGYLPSESDAYVSLSIIRRNGLRKGDYVVGLTRPAQNNEKYAAIQKVISVNDIPADELGGRVRFADLTPIYPDERLIMEHGKNTATARVIDLVSPIGKGQRGLIVSPPKAGKTTVLKDIAAAISANNPEVHLMCLLVDERPEEVTDMERSIKGEVISSTFDKPCENHIAVAELVIERAKRLVEQGRDVVILLDSITRLARAYNMGTPASGRILSGGVDSSALYPPKRFLGAARNIENGGSLTILGTALVDTGSKMDEVIFEEFKGTGNMELKLDRSLADKRIFPAIDPITSGTRKEELLLDPQEAPLIWAVRRVLANLNNTERAMDTLVKSIKQTETNQEFLIRFARKAQTSTKQDSLDL